MSTKSDQRHTSGSWCDENLTAVKIHDRLSRETYTQIAEAARARGLPVVGHIPVLVPIEDVIKERQRDVEHLGGLTHGILMACSHGSAARQRLAAALVPEDVARCPRRNSGATVQRRRRGV